MSTRPLLTTLIWVLTLWTALAQDATPTYGPPPPIRPAGYEPPAHTAPLPQPPADTPRNVILLIGDGLGLEMVTAARLFAAGADGCLHLERLPVLGLMRTHSLEHLVTDSAAASTAMATGFKTRNGHLGLLPCGTPLPNVMTAARQRGLRTGLVATASLTHATPAGFAAQVPHRERHEEIARQLIAAEFDVLLGGGLDFFRPAGDGGARQDGRDLLAEARQAGYQVVFDRDGLADAGDRVLGMFAPDGLTTFGGAEPSLAEMTRAAIDRLAAGPAGFLVMIEGSQIDWACHDQHLDAAIRQTLLFDQAVAEALAFAERDGRTLVIVTADHATGGLIVLDGRLTPRRPQVAWTTPKHTPAPVPVYAFGPGAERFMGNWDNTQLPRRIARLLDLPWPDAPPDRAAPDPAG